MIKKILFLIVFVILSCRQSSYQIFPDQWYGKSITDLYRNHGRPPTGYRLHINSEDESSYKSVAYKMSSREMVVFTVVDSVITGSYVSKYIRRYQGDGPEEIGVSSIEDVKERYGPPFHEGKSVSSYNGLPTYTLFYIEKERSRWIPDKESEERVCYRVIIFQNGVVDEVYTYANTLP